MNAEPESEPLLQISAETDRRLVTLWPNGTLEYGPDYTPDEAARVFWEALRIAYKPEPLILELEKVRAERDALRSALDAFLEATSRECGGYGDCICEEIDEQLRRARLLADALKIRAAK